MSCTTCHTKFSFFTKEHACPGCGFSNCSKCLKYKCIVPDIGLAKVCGACNRRINLIRTNDDKSGPGFCASCCNSRGETISIASSLASGVDIVSKLETLENPAKPPIVIYEKKTHWDVFKQGLDPADQNLVDRLQKLKDEDRNIPPPTVDEIKHRLMMLKEVDSDHCNVNTLSPNPEVTPQDADHLLQEYISQLKLSSNNDPCKEIQDKLNSLRDTAPSNSSALSPDCSCSADICCGDDTDHVTHKLIGAALAEAQLDANMPNVDIDTDIELGIPDVQNISEGIVAYASGMHGSDDEDDKPSCVMCDRTVGLMRCMGCTGDLYCPICFEDNHDDFELEKHKRVPFNPAKEFGAD